LQNFVALKLLGASPDLVKHIFRIHPITFYVMLFEQNTEEIGEPILTKKNVKMRE